MKHYVRIHSNAMLCDDYLDGVVGVFDSLAAARSMLGRELDSTVSHLWEFQRIEVWENGRCLREYQENK